MAQFDTINLAQIYGAADDTNFRRAQMEAYNKKAMREQQAYDMEEKLKGAYAIGEDGAIDEKTTLANLYRVDPMAANKFKQGLDESALGRQKLETEKENAKFNRIKQISGVYKDTATAIMANPTPEAAIANLTRFNRLTGEDVSQEVEQVSRMTPDQIKQWAAGHALEADKLLTKFETKDTNGQLVTQGIDPLTGKVTVTNQIQKTMSPAEIERNKIDKQRLGIDQAKFGLDRQKFEFDKTQGGGGGKAPAGYQFKPDGTLMAIPGGPADIKAGEIGQKAEQRRQNNLGQTENVINAVDEALNKVGFFTTGLVGSNLGILPSTDAYDLKQTVETIKANLGFQQLQAMREASPTGGALGSVAVQELNALQSTIANLNPNQSQEQITKNLKKVRQHMNKWRETLGEAPIPEAGQQQPAPSTPKPGTVVDGYIFNGGNPADPKSWKKK
jgi:hypothetical protein